MNDMFLDDIKKDVSVTTYTDTSTSAIHTYPDDAIITDIINCVNTAFPDTSRQQRMIYVHKIINCHRPYSDGGIVPNPLTDKDAQNYTIGFRSKLRQFAFKIYIEQLPNGIIDFIKRVQSVEKTTYQVIAIIHDRDIKLDVHDLYAEARLKPHIHIIVRCTDSKKRVHVQTVMNMLGIVFRKGIDDALIVRNKGIDTIHKKFAIATTYLTHDTEDAAKHKEHYELDEYISNLSIEEIQTIRDVYTRLTTSTNKVDKQRMAELDEYAFNIGYELKDFDEWYNTLSFAERCNASMKTVQESYMRGCQKKFDERVPILRKCIFIHGAPNTGKTYATERALAGRKTLHVGGGGTGKFDSLKPSHDAIIVDDDVCPNLLNMSDNYACKAYRRGRNNPIWAGEWLIVTSNLPFREWLFKCGFSYKEEDSHVKAMFSRFFVCKVVGDDSSAELYLLNPSTRGLVEEQKQRMRDFLQFQKVFNDTIQNYHAEKSRNDFDAFAFVTNHCPFGDFPERQKKAFASLYDNGS